MTATSARIGRIRTKSRSATRLAHGARSGSRIALQTGLHVQARAIPWIRKIFGRRLPQRVSIPLQSIRNFKKIVDEFRKCDIIYP